MKSLLILFIAGMFTHAINAQNKPGFYTDKGTKLITEGNSEELLTSNDIEVKIPIDSSFHKYDNLFVKITISTSDPRAHYPTMACYRQYFKEDHKKEFNGKNELFLFITNPDDKTIAYGGAPNYAGDFLSSADNTRFGASYFWLCGQKKKKKCTLQVKLIVKGYRVTGTKQKWNSNDQSWSTVDVYDDGEVLSETQISIN